MESETLIVALAAMIVAGGILVTMALEMVRRRLKRIHAELEEIRRRIQIESEPIDSDAVDKGSI